MGITAILFDDAERFEQIDNMPSTESGEIGQAVSETKTFKDDEILHFPHTRAWECQFDLAIERSKVNLETSFESIW